MEIIEHPGRELHEDIQLSFSSKEGWGYSFDCDRMGNVKKIGPYAWANFNRAIDGFCNGELTMKVVDYSSWVRTPLVIRCTESVPVLDIQVIGGKVSTINRNYVECGEEIALWGDERCEKCGQWYNSSGQRLRSNWMDNPSNWDDSYDDMEGYEIAELRAEAYMESNPPTLTEVIENYLSDSMKYA